MCFFSPQTFLEKKFNARRRESVILDNDLTYNSFDEQSHFDSYGRQRQGFSILALQTVAIVLFKCRLTQKNLEILTGVCVSNPFLSKSAASETHPSARVAYESK